MEEKKLTDEKSMFNYIANDVLGQVKPLYLRKRIVREVFDLIHRLQEDYSNLKERYVKVLGLNEKVIAEQKAEIERLTAEINQRREMMSRMDCNYATELQKNAELQKQVKSLTEENKELYKENTTLIAGSILERKDIAKDTAREIFETIFYDCWAIKDEHGHRIFVEGKIKDFAKKCYGVDVE